jgi:Tol biopolymer transport system component
VGIDDHWYREIARTDPNGTLGGLMSSDGQRVLFEGGPLAAPAEAADGSSLVGATGVFVYDGATKKVSRVALPADVRVTSISAGWRFAAGVDGAGGIVLLDLQAGTAQPIGTGVDPAISADGSVVVWASRPFETGILPGHITRYDRAGGSSADLGIGAEPAVSGDGSRIASRTNQGFGHLDSIRYLDIGDPDWTVVAQDTSSGALPRLSTDGRHLLYSLSHDMFGGKLYDLDLSTGTTIDFGPLSGLSAVSPNGNHVLYWSPLGTFRWSR